MRLSPVLTGARKATLFLLLYGPLHAQDVTAGQREFRQTCGFCHGLDGRGASGPDLIRSSLVNHDVYGNLIGPVIRNGRPEKGMPAFSLPDDKIRALAEFLHSEA